MNKMTVRDVDLRGKRVLMRVDYNVPLNESGIITDDSRIVASLPTIQYILSQGASLILISHLGRPKGKGYESKFSLKPVHEKLKSLLGFSVKWCSSCASPVSLKKASYLKPGQVMLCENTRFYADEGKADLKGVPENKVAAAKNLAKNDQRELANWLTCLGDGSVFVQDAFACVHRAHASTTLVCADYQYKVAGLLIEKEVDRLIATRDYPEKPFLLILGGAKVSDKIEVIEYLLDKVDAVLIGGLMAYTFLAALGKPTGSTKIEEESLPKAIEILRSADEKNIKIVLPVDSVVNKTADNNFSAEVVGERIEAGWRGLGIGPKTIELFKTEITKAKTVFWNGPLGLAELEVFSKGTKEVAESVANLSDATTVIGGGDTVSVISQLGLSQKITFMSTGGGATLEFLSGKKLPGLEVLTDK